MNLTEVFKKVFAPKKIIDKTGEYHYYYGVGESDGISEKDRKKLKKLEKMLRKDALQQPGCYVPRR